MYKQAKPLFLICETPLHAGSGSDLGIVDLPIQRERHTSFPKIEASSLKGALREALQGRILNMLKSDNSNLKEVKQLIKKLNIAFGFDGAKLNDVFTEKELKELFTERDEEEKVKKIHTDFAGCIGFTDARLLLFPVKSLYGVFAWITCPRVIKRFLADLQIDLKNGQKLSLQNVKAGTIANSCKLFKGNRDKNKNEVTLYLEEFVFKFEKAKQNNEVNKLGDWLAKKAFTSYDEYWKNKIKTDIVVLEDDDFRDFVNLSTEVITRTKINNETGTVQDGALFTEEYLPAESVLYSMAMFTDEFREGGSLKADDVKAFFEERLKANKNVVQIGGNATLGKGIVKTKLVDSIYSTPKKQ